MSWTKSKSDYALFHYCFIAYVLNGGRYFLRPNFALTPVQAFLLSAESADQQPKESITEIHRFNLREAKGPPLASPLPDAGRIFMIYTAVEILNHLNGIPKGFINHTTWEPQALPLVSLNRDGWNSHQLVPWTGSEPVWIELTINNIDGTGHPYHLVSDRRAFFPILLADVARSHSMALTFTLSLHMKDMVAGITTTRSIR